MILHSSMEQPEKRAPRKAKAAKAVEIDSETAASLRRIAKTSGLSEKDVVARAVGDLLELCDFGVLLKKKMNGSRSIPCVPWWPYLLKAWRTFPIGNGRKVFMTCEHEPDGSVGWCGEIRVEDGGGRVEWWHVYHDKQRAKSRRAERFPVFNRRVDLTSHLLEKLREHLAEKAEAKGTAVAKVAKTGDVSEGRATVS